MDPDQYEDDSNLQARQRALSGDDPSGIDVFFQAIFDQYPTNEPQLNVLEVGCGNAALWRANRARVPTGWKVTLVDISPGMLTAAKRATQDEYHYLEASLDDLPIATASVDLLIANFMLYHVEDLDAALSEARRVLRPRGHLHAMTAALPDDTIEREVLLPLLESSAIQEWNSARKTLSTFCGENGAAWLRKYFSQVNERVTVEHTAVDDATRVIDGILSLGPTLRSTKREPLETALAFHLITAGPIVRERRTHHYIASL